MRERPLPNETLSPWSALFLGFALLAARSPLAAPETLVIVKAKTDTFFVHIDYDRDPDVAPDKPWTSWDQIKVDSFYVTDSGTADQERHVRFAHPFYAEVNGVKGSGSDYIFFQGWESDMSIQYTAEIGFDFKFGDTLSGWQSPNGWHMAEYPRLPGHYAKGLKDGDTVNFSDYRTVGEKDVSDHVFLDFAGRHPGWIGKSNATALAGPRSANGESRSGWWVGPSAHAILTVPAAATRLRLIDATGRTAWEAQGLMPGTRLSAPAELRPGVFRCLWSP